MLPGVRSLVTPGQRLKKLQQLNEKLRYLWYCGIPNCDGAAGHRLGPEYGNVIIPFRHARSEQLPPEQNWYVWCLITGRGFGKTRTGAEFVKRRALADPGHRTAIIVPDFAVGKDVCMEGESGLVGRNPGEGVIPSDRIKSYNKTTAELTLTNGSFFQVFGTNNRADAESLRGYQCHTAWFEELGTQRHGDVAWDMLEFALRLGDDPRIIVTTTPRRIPIITRLLKEATLDSTDVIVTRGSTLNNAANLPPATIERLKRRYEHTSLGRQELYGELLEDAPGALWTPEMIEVDRILYPNTVPKQLDRVVVGVDPAGSHKKNSDETGIVVAGIRHDHLYPLADYSGSYSTDEWRRKAVDAYHQHQADAVIGESNFGGEMVEQVLRDYDKNLSYRSAHASRGKALRAEPIVMLYQQHRVHHDGRLPDLEGQMTTWVPPGRFETDAETGAQTMLEPSTWSPDRLDALVWAATDLTQKITRKIRSVS